MMHSSSIEGAVVELYGWHEGATNTSFVAVRLQMGRAPQGEMARLAEAFPVLRCGTAL